MSADVEVMAGAGPDAIVVRGLGKRYPLGPARSADGLYERLVATLGRPRQAPAEGERAALWALRDVSFRVGRGEVLGVVGRNGSGNSTLLRILARVTAPTEGEAETRGSVGSLLSLGSGFHPELTGRDNIALAGALRGIPAGVVEAERGAIVEFAGIGRFLDMPVKHYSSGMYARLAFSVSIHLLTEILLVDELLAVGDEEFRERSHARLRQIVRAGRSVVYVSHIGSSIAELCDRAIVLDGGRLCFDGAPDAALAAYRALPASAAVRGVVPA
ncbi:MAG: ABC transporter ATP-binding protein [Chloroflexota bacterium]